MLQEIGYQKWKEFRIGELYDRGTAKRCDIIADGKNATLDFYFKKDGSTTIQPTGKNTDISIKLKEVIEEKYAQKANMENKSYSLKKVPDDWANHLIEYLTSLNGVTKEEKEITTQPPHKQIVLVSDLGDRITINIYRNGTLMLQGKPAYLYSEAVSFLSYCDKISITDIVESVNQFHDIDINVEDIRNELQILMPRAYGNVDDTIIKLLSPSISLRRIKIPLEDYSCYAFPALRALEGYLKYLFSLKDITIGHTFYKVFNNGSLISDIASKIDDKIYQGELERVYEYFVSNRHVIFHTNQILIGTTILESKQEADEIVNTVLTLIETSFKVINKI